MKFLLVLKSLSGNSNQPRISLADDNKMQS